MELSILTQSGAEASPRLMSNRWTITTATAHAGFPTSKLGTNNLADQWWAWNQRASGTWISAVSDTSPDSRTIATVAVLGLNRTVPTHQALSGAPVPSKWRVRIDSFPLADRVRPGIASISSLVNLTGVAADIAGPLDPPTPYTPAGYAPTKLEATNPALGTSFRVTFDNHHATERALTGTQVLRIFAADSADPETVLDVSRVTATVVPSSGSSFVPSQGAIEVTPEGCIFNFSWTASQLTVPTATVRVDVGGTTSGGTTVEFLCVEWVAELAAVTYDSGEVTQDGTMARMRPGVSIPADQTRYMLITFSDFSYIQVLGLDEIQYVSMTVDPLRVGRLVGSEDLTLTPSSSDGRDFWNVRPVHGSQRSRMRGGGLRARRSVPVYKEGETRGVFKLESEAMDSLLHSFYDVVGPNVPILVMPHADRPQDDLWAVIERFDLKGAGVAAGADGTGRRYDLDASFMEYTAKIAGR